MWRRVSSIQHSLKEKLGPSDLAVVAASVKDVKYNYEWEVELIQNHVNSVEEKISEMNWWVIIIESFAHTSEGQAKKVANFTPEVEVWFKSIEEWLNQFAKQYKTQ